MIRELLAKGTNKREETEPESTFVKDMQKWKVYSFKQGVETLTRALADRVSRDPDTNILLKATVTNIEQVPPLTQICTSSISSKYSEFSNFYRNRMGLLD